MFYRIVFKTPRGEKAQPWPKGNDLDGATEHARDNAPRHKATAVRFGMSAIGWFLRFQSLRALRVRISRNAIGLLVSAWEPLWQLS